MEREAVLGGGRREVVDLVVAVDADQRGAQRRERVHRARLRDVVGVDHALDTRRIEQLHDPPHVGQQVVGVADDADPHPARLAGRPGSRTRRERTRSGKSRVASQRF